MYAIRSYYGARSIPLKNVGSFGELGVVQELDPSSARVQYLDHYVLRPSQEPSRIPGAIEAKIFQSTARLPWSYNFV